MGSLANALSLCFPSLSFRVDLTGHCAEGGGSEVPMQVTRSLCASLPKNLSVLDRKELRDARRYRDERMSLLFCSWPSLTDIELRELRNLSDERQRLARHVGILRGHALGYS